MVMLNFYLSILKTQVFAVPSTPGKSLRNGKFSIFTDELVDTYERDFSPHLRSTKSSCKINFNVLFSEIDVSLLCIYLTYERIQSYTQCK